MAAMGLDEAPTSGMTDGDGSRMAMGFMLLCCLVLRRWGFGFLHFCGYGRSVVVVGVLIWVMEMAWANALVSSLFDFFFRTLVWFPLPTPPPPLVFVKGESNEKKK